MHRPPTFGLAVLPHGGFSLQAWTYSRLESFETCPKKFYHLSVAKDYVDPPTEATKWGERVHKAFEDRITIGTPLPEGMTQWNPIAEKLDALPGEKLAEQKLAIDRNFKPAPWQQAWSRGIADLLVTHKDSAVVIDYKTGKRKPSEQLALYAAYTFALDPSVEKVTTGFVWLKEKKIDKQTFTKDDIPSIWKEILPKVHKLESAYERDSWPAKPSGLCKGWCPVTSCPHNSRRI
jgi:CRISPR/Cas system-associated exonuclease Cas4 (RecB family)